MSTGSLVLYPRLETATNWFPIYAHPRSFTHIAAARRGRWLRAHNAASASGRSDHETTAENFRSTLARTASGWFGIAAQSMVLAPSRQTGVVGRFSGECRRSSRRPLRRGVARRL